MLVGDVKFWVNCLQVMLEVRLLHGGGQLNSSLEFPVACQAEGVFCVASERLEVFPDDMLAGGCDQHPLCCCRCM